jgi:uncharacterized protein YpbB
MDTFILALFRANDKLRGTTLSHLLIGKRTSSVLTFGFFHHILPFLGILSHWSSAQVVRLLDDLCARGWLSAQAGEYAVTTQGASVLAELPDLQATFAGLDYFRYGRMSQVMWETTQLAVQVKSEQQAGNSRYVPVTNRLEAQLSVKKWLKTGSFATLPTQLTAVFQQLSPETANFLARQLSGHQVVGLTAYQLVPEAYRHSIWATCYAENKLHQFYRQLKQTQLLPLVQQLDQRNFNRSMVQTRQLFLAGCSLAEVQRRRNLKLGTVSDHLIEWALLDEQFPYEQFVEARAFAPAPAAEVIQWRYRDFNDRAFHEFRLFQIGYVKGRIS